VVFYCMEDSGGWLQGIHYFRAIAIIEIVTFHVVGVGALAPNPLWITVALRAFTSFGVPHFIFISGVVLYNKYNNGFSLSAFYKRRFNAVVPPYLVWSTFYFAVYYVVPTVYTFILHLPTVHGSNQSVVTLASTYLEVLIVGYQFLWFVPVLIQLYLLYPLLEKMYARTTRQNSQIYILSFLLLAQISYVSLTAAFSSQLVGSYLSILFLSYVFYFVLGFFIARHYEAMKQRVATFSLKSISLMVLASTIYYSIVYYHAVLSSPAPPYYTLLSVVTGPFYCLVLILFYLRISTTWQEPRGFFLSHLEKIGEDSFGIFLVHWFFVGTFTLVLFTLGLSAHNLILYPVLFVLTLISSYLTVQALYRLPISNIIIGKPRKRAENPTAASKKA